MKQKSCIGDKLNHLMCAESSTNKKKNKKTLGKKSCVRCHVSGGRMSAQNCIKPVQNFNFWKQNFQKNAFKKIFLAPLDQIVWGFICFIAWLCANFDLAKFWQHRNITFRRDGVRFHVSCVGYQMSQTLIATAADPPPADSPTMHSRMLLLIVT